MRRYLRNDENTTEPAVRTTMREDLYLVVAGLDDQGGRAALKVFINPLQMWLWVGALIMVAGTLVVLVPRAQFAAKSVPAADAARIPER
jgi:cytochrome c-type biogenesis protein CcmF